MAVAEVPVAKVDTPTAVEVPPDALAWSPIAVDPVSNAFASFPTATERHPFALAPEPNAVVLLFDASAS